MKLRNLMYATMIACAFASCSKDDEGGQEGPEVSGATLSVRTNQLITKSTTATGATDETISNLRIYVFNGNGTYQTQQDASINNEVTQIPVKPGTAKIVAVANYTVIGNPADVDALYATLKDWNNEMDGSLTMNSQTYDVSLAGGKTNYLGYTAAEAGANGIHLDNEGEEPVKMYRNVAKVKLASISVDAIDKTQFPEAQFKIDGVFILHGSAATKLVGGASKWAPTFVATGAQKWVNASFYSEETYKAWVATMKAPGAGTKIENYVDTDSPFAFVSEASYGGTDLPTTVISDKAIEANVDSFYVYENPKVDAGDINTLLVVKGRFFYTGITVDQATTTFYSVPVGKRVNITAPAGAAARTADMTGVLRNLQYNISLTVKSPGYLTPFGPKVDESNTALDVKVEVVDFGQVNQSAEI